MQQPTSILKESSNPSSPQHGFPAPNTQKMSRPRTQLPSLQIPTPAAPMPAIHTASPLHSPYGVWLQSPMGHPMTPVTGKPMQGIHSGPTGLPIGLAGNMGRFTLYPSKAGEFMFKQFEGFKDFTMNTAKSGLSRGEKTAFWLHAKVSSWSKRWFTHIFLLLVIFAFSLLGALIFVEVEGSHEDQLKEEVNQTEVSKIREKRYELLIDLHNLSKDRELRENQILWTGHAQAKLFEFEIALRGHLKKVEDKPKVWTFSNALFYCGTIYTTIGK